MKKIILMLFVFCASKNMFAQNVGIGTVTPTEKLQVIGNIKSDTLKPNALQMNVNVANGKILTSDAIGNGTWQTNAGLVKALNGLTKTTDSIMLGGLLQTNTAIRLNTNTFTIADTGNTIGISVNQINNPLSTSLSNTPITQSFIAANNGSLINVDVYVAAFSGANITLQIEDNTGLILGTATNNFGSLFNNWSTFTLSNVLLNSGKKYVISISAPSNAQVYYDNTNPYAAGLCNLGSSNDLAFRVFTMDEKNTLTIKAGKLGVNNNFPTSTLDVNGSIKISDGTHANGKILMSDAIGKASWQDVSTKVIGGWSIKGNANTDALNFIGTTDNQTLRFKVNNVPSGEINPTTGNSFFGLNAGRGNTTGFSNVAIGIGTLRVNTNKNNLVAIGDSALYNNGFGADPLVVTDATNNTAVGSKSLFTNTTGNTNTATGYQTLFSNTSGSANTANGHLSLYSNAVGYNNTATGYQALYNNVDGSSNTATGFGTLFSNITGTTNTASGYQALYSNTFGNNNVASGYNALYLNTTGSENTASGMMALYANTTGYENVAIGSTTLTINSTGKQNTALGNYALGYNTGSTNTAVGYTSLFGNTSAYSNVAVGVAALRNNSDRSNLVAIGDSALYKNGTGAVIATDGTNNTAIGSKSLFNNTKGNSNTALGYQSLFANSTGSNNTAMGVQSLTANTTGNQNVAIGTHALDANTNGVNNTAIGSSALGTNISGANNVANGFEALFSNTGDNNTAIGASALYSNMTGSGNVAVGLATLDNNTSGLNNVATGFQTMGSNTLGSTNVASGHFALFTNTTGYSNVAMGARASFKSLNNSNLVAVGDSALLNNIGNSNVAIGSKTLLTNFTGTNNTALGYKADVGLGNLINSTVLGANAAVANSNSMIFGNTSVLTWGFGRTSVIPGTALQVGSNPTNGNGANLTVGGVWTNASDSTKKDSFTTLDGDLLLSKIKQLPITRWKYKGTNEYHIGPMAQDFYKLFNVGINDISISSLDPAGIALRAIQEQQQQIEASNKKNKMMMELIEKMQLEIEALKQNKK